MKTFDIKKIEFTDIQDNLLIIEGVEKIIGNMLFAKAGTVENHEASKAIHKGVAIDVDDNTLQWMIEKIGEAPIVYYVKGPVLDFIKTLKDEK